MKRIYFLLFTTFVISLTTQGQATIDMGAVITNIEFKSKQVVPPSPEAAELGKYGNVPVGLFTGTPQINIPLYQYSGNALSLPVSLGYNASGFRPEEIATWVGLGWTLNAGGVVTRSVIGNPDVYSNYFSASVNPLNIPSTTDKIAYNDYMQLAKKGDIETQPDMYYFNFSGLSGKFLVKPDGTIVQKEKNNIKISQCIDCGTFSNFKITGNDGTKYEFYETESSFMQLDDNVGGEPITHMNYTYFSSWYITKVQSADGNEEILFEYYTTDQPHTMFNNIFQNQSIRYNICTNVFDQPCVNSVITKIPTATYTSTPPTVSMKRKYLKKITFKRQGNTTGWIDFESVLNQREDLNDLDFPGERLLQGIKVYANTTTSESKLIKEFQLTYGYFINNSGLNNPGKRLRLQTIQELPRVALTPPKPPHSFEYYDDGAMVDYSTTALDHWGYYNGSSNANLIPGINIGNGQFVGSYASRDANSECINTLIKKVTYPTGGYTLFEFEPHTAKFLDNTEKIVGGARIKRLTDYSFANQKAVIKNYEYTNADGTSSGVSQIPEYLTSSKTERYVFPDPGNLCVEVHDDVNDINTIVVSATSAFGLGSVQGSHIGYNRVCEYQTDINSNESLGKTVYEYHVAPFDSDNDDISNGDLLHQVVFDKFGKALQETENTYEYIFNNTQSLLGYKISVSPVQDNKNYLCKYNNGGSPYYQWRVADYNLGNCLPDEIKFFRDYLTHRPYAIVQKYKQLKQVITKVYDQTSGSYIATTTKMNYGNQLHNQPTEIEQSASSSDVVVTAIKYPLDYTIPSNSTLDNATTGIKQLQEMNIVGAQIEKVQYRQNSNGTNRKFINGTITEFEPFRPYPSKLYRLETSVPLTSFQWSSINTTFSRDSHYKQLGSFYYSSSGNLIQQMKQFDAPVSYIWDYFGSSPIAEVKNADAGDIAYTSFETDQPGTWEVSETALAQNRVNGGITGAKAFFISSGIPISKPNLTSGKNYLISYWAKNGVLQITTNGGAGSVITGKTNNGWTFYEHRLPQNITSVTLTSTNNTIDELRLHPNEALMATYTFDPQIGVSSSASENNLITYYDYDGFNRLVNVKDEKVSIVKNYNYNYGLGTALPGSEKTLFYNSAVERLYSKSNCPSGSEAFPIAYKVPSGRYVSTNNQQEADQKAWNDVDLNGQNYANQFGECRYYNVQAQSAPILRSDCYDPANNRFYGPPTPGMGIVYVVQARKHFSLLSQADADAKAQADILANAQANANANGSCTCIEVNKRWSLINGVWQCEEGVLVDMGCVPAPNCQPGKNYKRLYYYQFSSGAGPVFYTCLATSCGAQ